MVTHLDFTVGTLNQNTTGSYNTANGNGALSSNITGAYNTANGYDNGTDVVLKIYYGTSDSGAQVSGWSNSVNVGAIDVGSSTISAGGFDASDGNIDNVGIISLDKIEADGSAITIGTSTSGDTVLIGHGTSEVTIGDNLTVSGDLTVNGTTTTVDSTTVAIGDNMMKYAKDNTANSVDIGWYGKAVVSSANKFPTMFYDASSGISTPLFQVGLATTEPGSTGAIAVKGTVVANLSGNATGSSGSCTGNAATASAVAYTGLTGTVPTWNQATTGSAGITANANNITIDATVATLDGSQTLTNKSGNISQWTNDSGYLTAETDSQTLSFSTPNLTISNGNAVNLSTLTTGLITASSTDTFTNKTIDADGTGNSITNIENANIKAKYNWSCRNSNSFSNW